MLYIFGTEKVCGGPGLGITHGVSTGQEKSSRFLGSEGGPYDVDIVDLIPPCGIRTNFSGHLTGSLMAVLNTISSCIGGLGRGTESFGSAL